VTSDGGLLLVRELDERLGFGVLIQRYPAKARGRKSRLPLTHLVQQSVYSRLAGYGDVNDAEQLAEGTQPSDSSAPVTFGSAARRRRRACQTGEVFGSRQQLPLERLTRFNLEMARQ